MKAAVISLGSKSSNMLIEAMNKYFDSVAAIDLKDIEVNLASKETEVLYKGKPLEEFQCIYAKGSFKYSPLLTSLTAVLFKKSYMPIKPDAFRIANDKLLTQLVLQKSGIPMPTSYVAYSSNAVKSILEKINYPIMMKFPEGTQGKGVMFADSYAAASSMLDALEALKQPFIIQEYVDSDDTDIRAIVVGDKVVAAMKRHAEVGEKRANIHAGGKGEACILDAYTKKIAVQAAKAAGLDVCAVDILETVKGPVVIEINFSPGLQGITETTKINVADLTAKFLFEKAKQNVESKKVGASQVFKELGIPETNSNHIKEILTNLEYRANRILLPEVVSQIAKLSEKKEVVVRVKEGQISIKEMKLEE